MFLCLVGKWFGQWLEETPRLSRKSYGPCGTTGNRFSVKRRMATENYGSVMVPTGCQPELLPELSRAAA